MAKEQESDFVVACKEVIETMMKAFIEVMEEYIEPISDIGNPEKLIGKPYSEWKDNPFIIKQLSQIYGTQEPNPLSELIYKNEIKAVRQLEGEE